jgi:acyl carrier protein
MSTDQHLQRVFATVMGVSNLTDSASVTTVEDWDSQTHVVLIVELEKAFGISITAREAGEMLSVPEIKAVLLRKGIRN